MRSTCFACFQSGRASSVLRKSLAQCTSVVTLTSGSVWLPPKGSRVLRKSHWRALSHSTLHGWHRCGQFVKRSSQRNALVYAPPACDRLKLPLHAEKRVVRKSSAPILGAELDGAQGSFAVHGTKASPWYSPICPSHVARSGPRLLCNIVRTCVPS